MNFRKGKRAEAQSFQIAPMIDIVFLLLSFFMATAVYSQWERQVDIVLPTARSGEIPDRLPGEIIINIQADGQLSLHQQTLTIEELQLRLERLAALFPGQPVVVRADRQTIYAHIMAVMDACRQSDIWNISLATAIEDGPGS